MAFNVNELLFVPEMDVFSTCFTFGLSLMQVNFIRYEWQTLLSLANNGEVVCCVNSTEFVIIFRTFLRYLKFVLHILHKN